MLVFEEPAGTDSGILVYLGDLVHWVVQGPLQTFSFEQPADSGMPVYLGDLMHWVVQVLLKTFISAQPADRQ